MSGYGGPDDEALHAQVLADNGVGEVKARLAEYDPTKTYLDCVDCGDPIPEGRRLAVKGCKRCIGCQEDEDKRPKGRIRMLDNIL